MKNIMSSVSSNSGNNQSTTPSIMNLSPSQHQKQPQNISEWQLNVVLQRANLLQYYDTFISQGGDDVQQLLEAGEEEFLEIMALVGMASKPLHVRRLQKSLQEYSANPVMFQLMAFQKSGITPPPSLVLAAASLPPLPAAARASPTAAVDALASSSAASISHYAAAMVAAVAQANENFSASGAVTATAPPLPPPPMASTTTATLASSSFNANVNSESPGVLSTRSDDSTTATNAWIHGGALPDGLDGGFENYALPSTAPCLTETQVQRIAECAQLLTSNLPSDLEPKLVQSKKKVSREVIQILENSDVGSRLEQCRKFARIYGRFDTKRKTDKPLTLHEVSVNEAAAQICLLRPALLTRRDELFPLARQVVRDAGYHYMRISSDHKRRSSPPESICSDFDESPAPSTSTASDLSPGGGPTTTSALFNNDAAASSTTTVVAHCRRPSLSLLSGLPKKRRCLQEIGEEMQKIGREQDLCKMRVDEATDLVELHAIQRDLHRLTQRQMELSDEQADVLQLMRKESGKITKNGFEICNIFNHANIKRETTSSTPPNGVVTEKMG